ncbi:hypothetical protein MASR2M44_19490 [Bacteroidota bacterium]
MISTGLNELSINIHIAGRVYPLTVSSEEEAGVRAAGKLIQEKLQAYNEQFALKDQQDALALFALEMATQYQHLLNQKEKELAELESELGGLIQSLS